MATERLNMAIKNFHNMDQMVERYIRLGRAYVTLSERFHQLDVEHMQLKGQMVPLIKQLKAQQRHLSTLKGEQTTLQQALDGQASQHRQELQRITSLYEEKLQTLTTRLAELQPLEKLLDQEAYHALVEAEEQMELVETTLQEMETDSVPDLSPEDKALLADYQAQPETFGVDPATAQPSGTTGDLIPPETTLALS